MIGDSENDVKAGRNAGLKSSILLGGCGFNDLLQAVSSLEHN
jgi:phosphoglycolate phosphatase-like HAD superfamily hydrolase